MWDRNFFPFYNQFQVYKTTPWLAQCWSRDINSSVPVVNKKKLFMKLIILNLSSCQGQMYVCVSIFKTQIKLCIWTLTGNEPAKTQTWTCHKARWNPQRATVGAVRGIVLIIGSFALWCILHSPSKYLSLDGFPQRDIPVGDSNTKVKGMFPHLSVCSFSSVSPFPC